VPEPITMHVISHTHWDREWHLTFQEFRIRLVDLIDRLLDLLEGDPGYKVFHLDGQTIVLEDYLEIRPENEGRLRKLVTDGRILIGPWYLLNDEFLTSGEATIRNLLIGHAICDDWGSLMPIGYIPDQFGHISQMPQILRGFGLDNAIYGRGRPLIEGRKTEFIWRAPDGSQVTACLMAFWYNNAQRFPEDPDEALAYAGRARDQLLPHVTVPHLLLMNGVDHLFPQDNLPPILAGIQERLPEGQRIVHSTLPDYMEALRQAAPELETHTGEMREDRGGAILAGTLSARMYLKQANERCQTLLERWAEPMASIAWMLGDPYPHGYLTYAWKLLLQNHPHDSICGCSSDVTHKDMEPRFRHVEQIGEEHLSRSLSSICARVDTSHIPDGAAALHVWNSLNWERTDVVEAVVDFPADQNVRAIRVLHADGGETPVHMRRAAPHNKSILSPVELPKTVPVTRFGFALVARDVPSCGYATYIVEPAGPGPSPPALLKTTHSSAENEFLSLRIEADGSLSIDTKGDRPRSYRGLNRFADDGEVGDEYLHRSPVADRVVTSAGWSPTISQIEDGPEIARFEVAGRLMLPERSDVAARSDRLVPCDITSRITVAAGVPRIDIETTVVNRSKDHRLRALFPSGIDTDVVQAETPFDVVTRPARIPDDWIEGSQFNAQQSFVGVTDGDVGLGIINRGLPEYEALADEERTIALTLIRAVDKLSVRGEGPDLPPTEDAQMIGEWTFEYAIFPHGGSWDEGGLLHQAHAHNAPMRAVQDCRHDGSLPTRYSFLTVDPDELVVSCIKRAEKGNGLVVRCYNPTDADLRARLGSGRHMRGAAVTNMREERIAELPMVGRAVEFDVPSKAIITVELSR